MTDEEKRQMKIVFVVRFPKSMPLSFLLILSLVVINLSPSNIIKHTALMHQSIKITDLLNTHILIDIGP